MKSSERDECGIVRYNFGRWSNQCLGSLFPEITQGGLYLRRMSPSIFLSQKSNGRRTLFDNSVYDIQIKPVSLGTPAEHNTFGRSRPSRTYSVVHSSGPQHD